MEKISITVLVENNTLVKPNQYFNIDTDDGEDVFFIHSIDEINMTENGLYCTFTVSYCETKKAHKKGTVVEFPRGE